MSKQAPAAILNASGKSLLESIVETKAATIVPFVEGPPGGLHMTFAEGTGAAGLRDLLKPYVAKVVVCDPRQNALLSGGQQQRPDRCPELPELLVGGFVQRSIMAGPVYAR